MRTPTDYTRLRNRCDRCGHRVAMHTNGCSVKMRDPDNGPDAERGCPCRRTRTNG